MPTYEFRCPDGHDFEMSYRTISSSESETACPQCGKIAVRQISRSGFAFKGSGFYLTDYGKNAHRGTAPEAKPSDAAPSGGDAPAPAAASESKPASADTAPASSTAKSDAKPASPSKPSKPNKPSTGE